MLRRLRREPLLCLDPQAADKLFEAFYTTKKDGMGIGLSVSRSIAEAHHGRLWATLNDGHLLFLSLPDRYQCPIDAALETVHRSTLGANGDVAVRIQGRGECAGP